MASEFCAGQWDLSNTGTRDIREEKICICLVYKISLHTNIFIYLMRLYLGLKIGDIIYMIEYHNMSVQIFMK